MFLHEADDGLSVHIAHPQVGQNEVELLGLDAAGPSRPLVATAGVAPFFKDLGDGFGVVPLVVDDQDAEPVAGRFDGGGIGLHARSLALATQGPAILPARRPPDMHPANPAASHAAQSSGSERRSSPAESASDGKDERNPKRRGRIP